MIYDKERDLILSVSWGPSSWAEEEEEVSHHPPFQLRWAPCRKAHNIFKINLLEKICKFFLFLFFFSNAITVTQFQL